MIKKVSDLLQKLIERENEILKAQDIKHGPTIGDMYEGLTQDILDKSLPSSSTLDVSSGFIVDKNGNISEELDCLVVTSEGKKVPYTSKRKYMIDDVVAVIQVKKNLYSKDIKDGYENLLSVMEFEANRARRAILLQDAYQSITRRPLPRREDVADLPFEIQMIYHALVTELASPARIILGYNGFKSHARFRQSFIDYLESHADGKPKKGYGPTSFPSLIVCGQYSLIKCNGMPFVGSLDKDNCWPFYCSSSSNPMELVLQVIWTKLVYDDKLSPAVFDDDVWLASFARFLSVKCLKLENGTQGWAYGITTASDANLQQPEEPSLWEPAFLDLTQHVIITKLGTEGEVDLLDPELERFLSKEGYTVDTLVASLNDMGLAARDGNSLVLLTRSCASAILPDGRFATGENISGQLIKWVNRYMENKNGPNKWLDFTVKTPVDSV